MPRVDQASIPSLFWKQGRSIAKLNQAVGRWSYATPVAPATPPANYNAADPFGVPFQNGVTNVAGQIPLRYRQHPASRCEIEGALNLGSDPSFPVLICTLPGPGVGLWPTLGPEPCQFPSTDGTAVWAGLVDTSGNVWVTGQVAT